ncbi:hypothetical protein NFI96_004115 [Prochilodus magdalenae]|nr:hypothetical protein NFI96_004115 [Prochilodus magdalenae]
MDSADNATLQQALAAQGALLGKHDETLSQLAQQMQELTLAIQQLARPVQGEVTPPAPLPPPPAASAEVQLPAPIRYDGEPGGCRGFLLQCSLAFQQAPTRYHTEQAKVAYMMSLLTGRALAWATALWESNNPACLSSVAFTTAMRRTFDGPVRGRVAATALLNIHQGSLSVADYTIDFRTLAAESGWNPEALGALYQQGLNEDLKDELATRDLPNTLEDLYELAIKLDNRMRERRRASKRTSRGARSTTSPPKYLVSAAPEAPEPMQIGRAHLTPQEVEQRRREGRCLYCGKKGHMVAQCPAKPGKDQAYPK